MYRQDLDVGLPPGPLVRLRNVDVHQDHWGNNRVGFEFAALSFSNELAVRYRTRLLGYEKDWSAATSDTRIRYTNLAAFLVAKTYVFEVDAGDMPRKTPRTGWFDSLGAYASGVVRSWASWLAGSHG